jgi:hypothetical protein
MIGAPSGPVNLVLCGNEETRLMIWRTGIKAEA